MNGSDYAELQEEKAVVIKGNGIVMPAVTPEKAVEAFKAYQVLAEKITTPDDTQMIQGKVFKKKSFWRKVERFFNLSLELREERREEVNGGFVYHFVYRAIAPNGAYMDGVGSCSSNEKGLVKTEHNTRAIAETRAKNRAIADLCAFGEVSAEEINGEETYTEPVKEVTRPANMPTSQGSASLKQVTLINDLALKKGLPVEEVKALVERAQHMSIAGASAEINKLLTIK